MKKLRKVMVLVLALSMILTFGAFSVFAVDGDPDYSITVNGAKKGETYSAFKMFDLSVNDPSNPTAFRYTVNSDWSGFTSSDEFKAAFTIDAQGYVTAKDGVSSETAWVAGSVMSELAEAAARYAKDNNIGAKASVKANADGSVKLEVGSAGYYVVSSTLGTRAMIETTPAENAVTVNEKNSNDTVDKEVQDDDKNPPTWGEANDSQVGDTVKFKSKVKVAPRSINVVVHDKMDDGLTFSGNSSIELWTDEDCSEALDSGMYTVKTNPDEGDTFTIKIADAFAAETTEDAYIWITYTAVVNKDAIITDDDGNPIIDPQTNDTHVRFGDGTDSEHDTTETTTHKFAVYKHQSGSESNLADAVFQVLKDDVVVKLIKIDETNYRVADASEASGTASSHANNGELNTIADDSLVSDFVTVASGDIVIWGVDSDEYTLHEVQPPKGYNALDDDPEVTVDAGNATRVDVENNTGTELPSTGGIGTTIFYIVGSILVIGAAIMLVSRRRLQK